MLQTCVVGCGVCYDEGDTPLPRHSSTAIVLSPKFLVINCPPLAIFLEAGDAVNFALLREVGVVCFVGYIGGVAVGGRGRWIGVRVWTISVVVCLTSMTVGFDICCRVWQI